LSLTVGEKIKKYRLEKGMTQEELGKELGVGRAAVQKYESNQVQNLKSAHIKKLCYLFNKVPWDFIFDGNTRHSEYGMSHTAALRSVFGEEAEDLFLPLAKLNKTGLDKVRDYIADIIKIEEYRK
jgi:transcriptional regulator with XRE-family HTH domain